MLKYLVKKYMLDNQEPELNSKFVKQVLKAQKQEAIVVDDFAKRYDI